LAVGSEGEGLRPLVRDSCDRLLRLPMRGRIESLNAAAAGSIALYLVLRRRSG
jgi:23S rRNA (guanosine2251-2'-O)-methyltransferase